MTGASMSPPFTAGLSPGSRQALPFQSRLSSPPCLVSPSSPPAPHGNEQSLTPPRPSEPTVGETMGSLSLVLFCFSPFYLMVLSHRLWSQTRPASASASCREPSLPWWWSWPSGELPRRRWGGWLGESSCPQTQAWGKRKTWCGRAPEVLGKVGCLIVSHPTGAERPFTGFTWEPRSCPRERVLDSGSSSNCGCFLRFPAWCPCPHCTC